jgi:hypothetical protein
MFGATALNLGDSQFGRLRLFRVALALARETLGTFNS